MLLKKTTNEEQAFRFLVHLNHKPMRSFYIVYPEFDRQCLANFSWSNIVRIIRIDNPEEKNYYLTKTASQNWSYRQLERNM